MKKIGLVSLGCAKNLIDSEMMLAMFSPKEYQLTDDPAEADLIIVNTCGFIEDAKKEAIETILEMAPV
jgi:ribosomal protein S12 methylthiotransferase